MQALVITAFEGVLVGVVQAAVAWKLLSSFALLFPDCSMKARGVLWSKT